MATLIIAMQASTHVFALHETRAVAIPNTVCRTMVVAQAIVRLVQGLLAIQTISR